jgi:hypothetical protein
MPGGWAMKNRIGNFGLAVLGGLAVFAAGIVVDIGLLGHERRILISFLVSNFVAGLVAIVSGLALQLDREERHFRFATEKAVTMAELNHNVRNAVFPVFLAVQRVQDPEANRLADEAMSRLEIALRDAAVDAYSGKIRYGEEIDNRVAA